MKKRMYISIVKQTNKTMSTLQEVKNYFSQEGLRSIENEKADYQFVKRADGVLLQYSEGEYKFYGTLDGFCKAALYRIKRG
jgi:hypothetical protein